MFKAAEALGWKNTGFLETFGLRLGDHDESQAPRTALERFFDHVKLCTAKPWGLITPTGIAVADLKHDRPFHLIYAHPQALYFDFAYCPSLIPMWDLRLRAIPSDLVRRAMVKRGVANVVDDMRRLAAIGGFMRGGNGTHVPSVAPTAAPAAKRREPGRQSKPDRRHGARRH